MKYFLMLFVVIMAISIPVVLSLLKTKYSSKKGNEGKAKSHWASSTIAILMIIVLGLGTFYMGGTLNFFKNISGNVQMHSFYLVVNEDSDYQNVKDIEGQTIGLMDLSDDAYVSAQEKVSKKVDVIFSKGGGYGELAKSLVNKQFEAILLNSSYYEMAIEDVEGFNEDTTRVIDEFYIVVETEVTAKPVDVVDKSFNVYISGIDTSGSIGNTSRTDVNMILTVNPDTKTILLTSIPRDYYVQLATKGAMDKLTHSGLYGIDETTKTIENLFGIDINYYARVNFTTVVKLVDSLGGVTVNSDYSFNARGRDGTTYSYNVGDNYLNGEQALAFARERKSFRGGDNQRVKNQQAVITGIINKATGSTAILTKYNSILNSLENNLQTNLSQKDITSLVKDQLNDMSGWTIKQQSVTGSGKMTPVYSIPHLNVYVMVPNQSSVSSASSEIKAVMGQ